MTENDYIAEYIKEKYKNLLGADFAIWKFQKMMSGIGKAMADVIKSIPKEDLEKLSEWDESE